MLCSSAGFRPLTGISLFLSNAPEIPTPLAVEFSSPHGDFSFSINIINTITKEEEKFSSPHGDFSFSIPRLYHYRSLSVWFSSPHGDFSFSIAKTEESKVSLSFRPLTGISLFLFIHALTLLHNSLSFRPLTGISLFLSYLIFPL